MSPSKKWPKATTTRAETILEVLVAVGVLSMMLVLAGELRVTAIRQSAEARHALIARNLADEGIEAMRAIVGQNRLQYASRLQDCWNTMPLPPPQSSPPLANCHQNKIQAGSYLLSRDFGNLSWSILSTTTPLLQAAAVQYPAGIDCGNPQAQALEQYRIRIDQPGEEVHPSCVYSQQRATNLATLAGTGLYFTPPPNAGLNESRRGLVTPYFRSLQISRNADTAIAVTSRIIYWVGSAQREVVSFEIIHQKPTQ